MKGFRWLLLAAWGSLACQAWIAPVQSGLNPCSQEAGCQAGEFCAEGLCFPRGCIVDGIVGPGEDCDDGNSWYGDGCTRDCQIARCGDGILRADQSPGAPGYEACDDGNENNTDACTNDCRLSNCGDGFVAEGEGEGCDDGNLENADACLNDCSLARCGDGILRGGLADGDVGFEACDDGNPVDGDACLNDCRLARCGDGVRRGDLVLDHPDHEACDDGNEDERDGCLSDCRISRCGDGFRRLDLDEEHPDFEACDDGNEDNTDACLNNCQLAGCGDGILRTDLGPDDPGHEACDDGNEGDQDGCLSNCEIARCGDGVVRRDLTQMAEAGFENCEPELDNGGEHCGWDCRLRRQPRRLAVTDRRRCLLHEERVWCSGRWLRADRTLEFGPVPVTPEGLEVLGLGNSNREMYCVLWTGGRASCHNGGDAARWLGIPSPEPLVDINFSSYAETRCSLSILGRVRCWTEENPTPVQIEGLANITAMDSFEGRGLAVNRDGDAFLWEGTGPAVLIGDRPPLRDVIMWRTWPPGNDLVGITREGAVIGLEQGNLLPGLPNPVIEVVRVGLISLCALDEMGHVYCRGESRGLGELGQGDEDPRYTFTRVAGLTNVVTIGGGPISTCALTESDELWCWGDIFDQQVEESTTYPRPHRIPGHPLP